MADTPKIKGRGSHLAPPNRFALTQVEREPIDPADDEDGTSQRGPATQFMLEQARSIVASNDSPDIPFNFSVNPYRGCEHGCAYCYARQTHEYLGFNAGIDFETKIVVKENAAALFRDFLARDAWKCEPIVFSGVTDCYQPAERRFRLTRACLEVAVEARQPIGIITKNALVLRDLDLLQNLAGDNLVHVTLAVTTLDAGLARSLEPRTSAPAARLRALKELSEAGIPTRVLIAPVIPGINDSEIPSILTAAKEAGTQGSGWTLLRLPLTVAPVFQEWLERERPEAKTRVEGRIRSSRDGKLNDPRFGSRMRGSGEIAEQIASLFRMFAKRLGLDGSLTPYDCTKFRPPLPTSGQLRLF